MNNSGALARCDIVGDENAPGISHIPRLSIGVVVKDPLVLDIAELGTLEAARDASSRTGNIVIAKLFDVGAECVTGHQEAGTWPIGMGSGGKDDVVDIWPHRQGGVGGQRPRGGGPGQSQYTGEPKFCRSISDQGKCHRDRLVLPGLIDVIVHAQFVVAQRSLVSPAVGQHTVTLIGKALVVELFERPNDAFHEGDIEGLVVVLKVHPARLASDVFFPFLRVAKDRIFGCLIEGGDSHRFNLAFVRDAQLTFGFELSREPMGIPAKSAVDLLAAHRVEPGEDVLRIPGQQVAVVRESISEGWPVIEHPFLATRAVVDGPLERVLGCPIGEHLVLEGWKRWAWLNARSVAVAGKSHGLLPDNGGGWTFCEDALWRGTTPLARIETRATHYQAVTGLPDWLYWEHRVFCSSSGSPVIAGSTPLQRV